ncbi:DAK2 domain-containing protein, partial [Kitasatospora nipponensis]|uniref:DAK2 domain-containing protein n=1 Tax=Kitasatospora nipponensis TaxID=258049 RepID=UPI0031E091B6
MQSDVDLAFTLRWLRAAADAVERHHEELTELDTAIGDGDHGSNLRRGFAAVGAALAQLPPDSSGAAALSQAGNTLITSVGGASGPLYGSALRA